MALLASHIVNDVTTPSQHIEWDFWTNVMLPLFKQDPQATIIAGALNYRPRKVFSHELLHAQFYENSTLQKIVTQFWTNRVSADDKKQFLKIMKIEKYDINNQAQVLNEFLGYTLEYGAPLIFPKKLIDVYRKDLQKEILALTQVD